MNHSVSLYIVQITSVLTLLFWLWFQYASVKPLGDRVLVKIKTSEEKTTGGILLPTAAQSKPQRGEVVEIGDGRTIGKNKVEISIQVSPKSVCSALRNYSIRYRYLKFVLSGMYCLRTSFVIIC